MSVESTFKNRIDIQLNHHKPLQSSLSQQPTNRKTSDLFKSPPRELHRQEQQQQTHTRIRTTSMSGDTPVETIPELTSTLSPIQKHDDKHERRPSELKLPSDRHEHTASSERRFSTPQLHLGALIPFRNQKHHHKSNPKDETNTTNNYVNSSTPNSSYHSTDTMTTKIDPPIILKSTTSNNAPRLNHSNSNDRLLFSQIDESSSSSSSVSSSFILEENSSEPRSAELFIIESNTPICVAEIYREHFYEHFHINYHGEFDQEGPFIVSLRCSYPKTPATDPCEARAIIRTPARNLTVSDLITGSNENNILQTLFNKAFLPTVNNYGAIGDPKANERIYLFDKTNDERFNCKIGVIYQRLNQTDEYDIFSNDKPSDEMIKFLEILSDRVRLKGFQKYRGDLDTKEDLHGEYSYYAMHENHEIMFNVAPLVPSTKANNQCIERKGLVGNAFVCIVFQDKGANFSPDFISGKVIQIYITVQPIIRDEQTYYKVSIWRRNDIASVIDPPGGTYKSDKSFVPYFLTLLLNCVNVAIESPSLRSRVHEQRHRLKCEELKKLCQVFSVGPIPDLFYDNDNMNYHMDMRPHTRSESFAGSTTTTTMTTTTESTNTNSDRTSPVLSKKKGFSRKIFSVFSSRSGSWSSASSANAPPTDIGSINLPPPPPLQPSSASLPDTSSLTYRTVYAPPSKELIKVMKSKKTSQAPARPVNPYTIAIEQPTPPPIHSPNPLSTENFTQINQLNTAALHITPRNRSNSSPDDSVNTNKSVIFPVQTINEEDGSSTPSDDDDEEEGDETEDGSSDDD